MVKLICHRCNEEYIARKNWKKRKYCSIECTQQGKRKYLSDEWSGYWTRKKAVSKAKGISFDLTHKEMNELSKACPDKPGKTKDRYHLSLQSRYHYTVGDEEMIVETGTFFWFNNKLPHSAHNIGDVDRISLVWDVPHNKHNPHHKVKNAKGFG